MNFLQFSGGLDSLACLILLHDMAGLNVLTVSTDGAYPERAAYLERVRAAYPQPKYHYVQTQRNLESFGYPVDVVPMQWTALGSMTRGRVDVRYQDAFACCGRGIWRPMETVSLALNPTVIVRGQRRSDAQRNPLLTDGSVIDGITYLLPIENWTRERVLQFVQANAPDLVPDYYLQGEQTSRDCMDCTAYLDDNRERLNALPQLARSRVQGILCRWHADVRAEMREPRWT